MLSRPVWSSLPYIAVLSIDVWKPALQSAGVEIYRVDRDVVHLAERVRHHLMDANVRIVATDDGPAVELTVRTQQSDAPGALADALWARIRDVVGPEAGARGFVEVAATATEARDPMDDARVLDVFYDVTFSRGCRSIDEAIPEARWALEVEKYVTP